MEVALMCLGLSQVAAQEFNGNGITTTNRLCTLTGDSLDWLIKQIHQDNQGAGLFIPFHLSNIYIESDSGQTGCT
jgi:hypothetical protein